MKACFERAIRLELTAQKYYLRIAENFSFEAGIRDAFLDLAAGENEHAKALEKAMQDESRAGTLEADAADTLRRIDRFQSRLSAMLSNAYGDFAGAFKISEEIENSEVNSIFLLLVSERLGGSADAQSHKAMMSRHVQKVADLRVKYPAPVRAKIIPRMR